jgi:hypothetical protein
MQVVRVVSECKDSDMQPAGACRLVTRNGGSKQNHERGAVRLRRDSQNRREREPEQREEDMPSAILISVKAHDAMNQDRPTDQPFSLFFSSSLPDLKSLIDVH